MQLEDFNLSRDHVRQLLFEHRNRLKAGVEIQLSEEVLSGLTRGRFCFLVVQQRLLKRSAPPRRGSRSPDRE